MTATGPAAVVQHVGTPEVIQVEALTVPGPDVRQVWLRVQAASVAHK